MAKQQTMVERYCASFINSEKPGVKGLFARKDSRASEKEATAGTASSIGPCRSYLAAGNGPSVTGAKLADDGILERVLASDVPIGELLTRREMQIIRSIVAGQTNKQMARTLCRSQRTIEYHRNRLMRKLNVHNSAELVKRAIAMGIV